MMSPSDLVQQPAADAAQPALTRFWSDRLAPALLSAVLGAVLLFGAGFSSKIELHNAAHDGRHSAGFPCH
jgi:cobalt transporter subunit CbtB